MKRLGPRTAGRSSSSSKPYRDSALRRQSAGAPNSFSCHFLSTRSLRRAPFIAMQTLKPIGFPLAAAFFCVWMLSGCSIQEDIVRLDMRLAALESAQANLEAAAGRSETEGGQLRTRFAEIQAQIDALRADLNRVKGGVEETQYALGEKLAKAGSGEDLGRLESRVGQIEAYLDLKPAEAPQPPSLQPGPAQPESDAGAAPPSVPSSPATVPETSEAIYQAAMRDFERGAYEAARAGFQKFLDLYPKEDNADNARFWLGETYYRERWYEKAILEYQEVIENFPDGNKVPASLLKQGLAFFNLGDKGNARLILKELIRKYPDSNEAKIARQKIEGMN